MICYFFFKTNLTIPLYILFNLLVHIREFHLEDRGSRKKIGLLAWVTFCVTLSAMIMHRHWICARFVNKQVGKRASWDKKVSLFVFNLIRLVCFMSTCPEIKKAPKFTSRRKEITLAFCAQLFLNGYKKYRDSEA